MVNKKKEKKKEIEGTNVDSMTDATNTFDQARFFQEHAEQVFQVVFETCMHQIEKIKRKLSFFFLV